MKEEITKTIKKYQTKLGVLDAYFFLKASVGYGRIDSVEFDLGPSNDSWTIRELNSIKSDLSKDLKQFLNHENQFLTINTEYRGWAVSGYTIEIGMVL
jgi:hypothetical protein